MRSFEEARLSLAAISAQLSSIVRTISAGVLAICWLFLSKSSDVEGILSSVSETSIVIVTILALTALAFDLLQYMIAYSQERAEYDKSESSKAEGVTHYKYDKRRVARFVFFELKQYFAAAAALLLVFSLAFGLAAEK